MAVQIFAPKRITIRDCNLSKKALEEVASQGQTKVMRFVGVLTDAKEEAGKDNGNSYHILTGDFSAVNLLTGDVYNARKAILPEVATVPLLDLLTEGRKSKGSIVKVAVDVAVAPFSPRNPDGLKYKFVASPLIKPSKKSIMDEILAEIGLPPLLESRTDDAEAAAPKKTGKK